MRLAITPLIVAAAAALPAGCSKDPNVPYHAPDAGVTYVPVTPPPPVDASAPIATSDAGPETAATAAEAALDVALMALADKDAPGMKPDGQPIRATLKETEHAETIVTLLPGRCYTIIAMSPPQQISDVEIRLNMMPFNAEALHSSKEKNPAYIGRGKTPTCPVAPIAIQYKIEVTAKKGAGSVIAQLFSRAK
ncbi:MAG: hypothetical protein KF819_29015 [Labilithrix sp.]|nr:hypothetical protein [Labilithrix sp.]